MKLTLILLGVMIISIARIYYLEKELTRQKDYYSRFRKEHLIFYNPEHDHSKEWGGGCAPCAIYSHSNRPLHCGVSQHE